MPAGAQGRGLGFGAIHALSEAPGPALSVMMKGGFPVPPEIPVSASVPRTGMWGAEVERGRGDLNRGT